MGGGGVEIKEKSSWKPLHELPNTIKTLFFHLQNKQIWESSASGCLPRLLSLQHRNCLLKSIQSPAPPAYESNSFSEISRNYLPLCSTSWWESLACFWFHMHQPCTHLERSSMTDVSSRCLWFGVHTHCHLWVLFPLTVHQRKGSRELPELTERSSFKKAVKVWTKCPFSISYSFKSIHINWATVYTNCGKLFKSFWANI